MINIYLQFNMNNLVNCTKLCYINNIVNSKKLHTTLLMIAAITIKSKTISLVFGTKQ